MVEVRGISHGIQSPALWMERIPAWSPTLWAGTNVLSCSHSPRKSSYPCYGSQRVGKQAGHFKDLRAEHARATHREYNPCCGSPLVRLGPGNVLLCPLRGCSRERLLQVLCYKVLAHERHGGVGRRGVPQHPWVTSKFLIRTSLASQHLGLSAGPRKSLQCLPRLLHLLSTLCLLNARVVHFCKGSLGRQPLEPECGVTKQWHKKLAKDIKLYLVPAVFSKVYVSALRVVVRIAI